MSLRESSRDMLATFVTSGGHATHRASQTQPSRAQRSSSRMRVVGRTDCRPRCDAATRERYETVMSQLAVDDPLVRTTVNRPDAGTRNATSPDTL